MNVCVFCGSSSGKNKRYFELARSMGKLLAENNLGIVYGGASIGLMGAIADGALEIGGKVIGVMPQKILDLEIGHEGLSEFILVDSMDERKLKMFELSDNFLVLPGGFGTLDEMFEVLTLNQLEIMNKKLWLLNENKFFTSLIDQAKKMCEEGFVSQKHYDLIEVFDSFPSFSSYLRNAGARK